MELSHIDDSGKAVMVDVSEKAETRREAVASGIIKMSRECYELLKSGKHAKGEVLGTARIAGIMGAKRTAELIPLCHILNLTGVSVDFETNDEECSVKAICTVKTVGKTGVEMEALTGVNIALLTIYDMCKAADKGMTMGDIGLCRKSGGKSGLYIR